MDYLEFVYQLRDRVEEKAGSDSVRVEIRRTVKSNDTILYAINIIDSENGMIPNIYLESVYDRFGKMPQCVECASEFIISEYRSLKKRDPVKNDVESFVEHLTDFEYIKEKIVLKVVNRKMSREFLHESAYIDFLDLAAVFYILIEQDGEEKGYLRVTEDLVSKWEVEKDELYEIALENMRCRYEYVIENIFEAMKELADKMGDACIADIDGKELERLEVEEASDDQMFTIFEKNRRHGAAVILMNDFLEKAAEKLESDIVIIPSSVNELICMRDSDNFDYDGLRNIVKEVNSMMVSREEVLSGNIYRYSRSDRKISII